MVVEQLLEGGAVENEGMVFSKRPFIVHPKKNSSRPFSPGDIKR
jgi:hypothetical protein